MNFIASLLLAIVFVLPLTVRAADYSVSPPIIDLELEKRDIVYKEITLTNQSGRQVRVYPSVNEISLDDNGAIESFVEPSMVEDRTTAVTSWIEVPRSRVEIGPGESVTIPVTFRVHPEVEAGEYHALIGFGDGSDRPEAERKVAQGTAPGTVVRIGVDKVQNQFLRLARFTVERFVTDNTEGSIHYTLHNPGSDPVAPAGEIIFYDNSGQEVASAPLNPENQVIDPEKEVGFTTRAPEELAMGKYKAFLSVEYGDNLTASIHDTAFFYVLPIKQLIIMFVIVLAISLFIALYVHRRFLADDEYEGAFVADVPLYIRTQRSESKDHDIDLSKKN